MFVAAHRLPGATGTQDRSRHTSGARENSPPLHPRGRCWPRLGTMRPGTIETRSISSWTSGRTGALVVGHYARFSRRVIAVRECPVHDDRGNAVAFALRDACQWADTHEVKSIAVRAAVTRPETMATLVVTTEKDKRVRAASRRALAGTAAPTSLHVNVHPRGDAFIFGRDTRHMTGPARLREEVGGASFLISPTSFFQTNVARSGDSRAAGPGRGTRRHSRPGSLRWRGTVCPSPCANGAQVVAIEENHAAVADGEASLRLNRVPEARCRFIAKPVEIALGTGPCVHDYRTSMS